MADSTATTTRLIAAMALVGFLPVTVLGGFPPEALLIHHHHGYDVHLHTITPNDSKEYLE